ncbi:hypothetical protein DRJ17_01745 [Candidatus Woesearchaeota archaeon]|nr:MAG: hypothetical protein DRJ17_01745 [Candidatus Woesearchaeota archaeon]
MSEKKLPEKKFRAGVISATIWENTSVNKAGQPVTYKTVSFDRRYLDKDNKWQSTNNLRAMDIPKARIVLQKAYEYLVLSDDNDKVEEVQIC